MPAGVERLKARTVVVGSGPGGATVARGLAQAGHEVLVLERGGYHKPLTRWRTMVRMLDHMGMLASVEGTFMVRLLTVGGSSIAFCGIALEPPEWLKDRHGIDLAPYVEEVKSELGVAQLPDRLVGEGAVASSRRHGRRASIGSLCRGSSTPNCATGRASSAGPAARRAPSGARATTSTRRSATEPG